MITEKALMVLSTTGPVYTVLFKHIFCGKKYYKIFLFPGISNTGGGGDNSVKRIFPVKFIIIQAPAFRDVRWLKRLTRLSDEQLL